MKSHSLISLPARYQVPLYLIQEELKCRKLFHILYKAGLSDCNFRPNLDNLILQTLGLDASDEVFDIYESIIEKRSKKIKADNNSLMKQAMKVYSELMNEKKKLSVKIG